MNEFVNRVTDCAGTTAPASVFASSEGGVFLSRGSGAAGPATAQQRPIYWFWPLPLPWEREPVVRGATALLLAILPACGEPEHHTRMRARFATWARL